MTEQKHKAQIGRKKNLINKIKIGLGLGYIS